MLYGALLRTEDGIEHDILVAIVVLVPSQYCLFSVKVIPSDCNIIIVYPVIAEPPLIGAVQLIITNPLTNCTVGGLG